MNTFDTFSIQVNPSAKTARATPILVGFGRVVKRATGASVGVGQEGLVGGGNFVFGA